MTSALQWERRWKQFRREALLGFFSGVGRVLPFSLRRRLSRRHPRWGYLMLGEGDFVIDDYLGDLKVRIDVRSATEREMLTGGYDPELLSAVNRWARGTCLDIGANVGAVTLAMARAAGPRGEVVAVEPGPQFRRRLAANLALNPSLQDRVTVLGIGLSDRPGTLNWSEDPWFPGNAWLLGKAGIPVEVTTLDAVWAERPALNFLKMDVEGMEEEILRGGEQTLRRHLPVMVLETSLDFERIRRTAVRSRTVELLRSWGYTLWDVKASRSVSYPDLPQNTLALPPGVQP